MRIWDLPICSSRHIGYFCIRNVLRYERLDWMAYEHICMLNLAPEELPDIRLRSSLFHDQIASDLNMASIQNGSVRSYVLDHRNQAWHLWIVNLFLLENMWAGFGNAHDDEICSSLFWGSQWSAIRKPISICILFDPVD